MQNKKNIILLDSHAILHRSYHAMQGFATKDGRPTGALYGFVSLVIDMCKNYDPHMVVACFDLPKPTFRHEVYKGYKDGRAKTDDALIIQLEEAKGVCEKLGIPVFAVPGFEADDMLGTIAHKLSNDESIKVIIASGDMDTLQLVHGDHTVVYTLKKGSQSFVYNEDEVVKRFSFKPAQIPDYKGLAGDTSDNIVGIKGVGPKTATELINKFGTIEEMYKAIHKYGEEKALDGVVTKRIAGLLVEGEEEALFSKTLATIRRDAPVEFAITDTPYKEMLDEKAFMEVCDAYEFRSLKNKVALIKKEFALPLVSVDLDRIEPSHEELNKLKILANLIHSEMTNPSYEDILSITDNKKTPKDAIEDLSNKVKDLGLYELYTNIELPVMKIVDKMNNYGVMVDVSKLNDLSTKLHKKLDDVSAKIFEYSGREFNISSPKQLGEVLYDEMGLGEKIKKTSKGARSTNAGELEKMKETHPIIPLIMDYRELSKMLSTYIDLLPSFVASDGRIHPTYIQTGAATGRFACTDPNLQNLPVKSEWGKDIRGSFIAPDGKVLLSMDYAQVDLRAAAILSKDPNLTEIFEKGVDVHKGTASFMFKKPEMEVTDSERRQAKAINFGILYGMGVNALKEQMGVDRATAEDYLAKYKETFSVLMDYLENVKSHAYKAGYTETILQRRREIPLLKSSLPFMRAQGERYAINAPIQGTSADILKLAMIDIDEAIEKEGLEGSVHLIMQIHDELVFEVDENVSKKAVKLVKEKAEAVLKSRGLAVLPLNVSISVSVRLE